MVDTESLFGDMSVTSEEHGDSAGLSPMEKDAMQWLKDQKAEVIIFLHNTYIFNE